jgi:hypothetical protein
MYFNLLRDLRLHLILFDLLLAKFFQDTDETRFHMSKYIKFYFTKNTSANLPTPKDFPTQNPLIIFLEAFNIGFFYYV